ncbi:MAG: TRAP transporter small permease [Planktomarina sp.]|nr:TRAP transporter small permease [Planktomarina sp.]
MLITNLLKIIITRGLEYLALACAALAALGLTAIVAVIVTSVMMRKFANSPLHITEEVVGLLLSVSLFLGLPIVTLRKKHVHVSLLTSVLKGKVRIALQMAGLLIGVTFFSWLIWEAIPWLEFAFKRNLKTETTRILLYPWMALMPISLSITGAIFVARLLGVLDKVEKTEIETLNTSKAP